jgi:peptidoglycan/LPS O-acetylase OafA/YrhL
MAGVVLAACRVYRPAAMAWMQARVTAVLAIGAILLVASLVLFDGARTAFWPCVIGYPLLSLAMAAFVVAASGGTWLARLDVPGAGWLARASYSLYLSHKLVFALVERHLDGYLLDHRYLRFGIFVVATLAGGALLHYTVERTFLRWRDRRAPASATLSPPKVIQGVSAAD